MEKRDKKLFFGVTAEDMAEQERAEQEQAERLAAEREQERLEMEKRQAATEEQAKQKKRANDLSILFNKYCSKKAHYLASRFYEYTVAVPAALWALYNILLLSIVFGTVDGETGELVRDYRIISDAYVPRKDGYVWYDRPEHHPEYVGKIHPNKSWYINMALIMLTVLAIIGNPKERIKNYKHNKNIKNEEAAVEMMYDLGELKEKYNLNDTQIKKLLQVVPYIISNISKDQRVYFDMLMEGKIKIKDNKTYYDMAVAILAGHLESHSEDYAKLQEVFAEESIPQQFKVKYGRQR